MRGELNNLLSNMFYHHNKKRDELIKKGVILHLNKRKIDVVHVRVVRCSRYVTVDVVVRGERYHAGDMEKFLSSIFHENIIIKVSKVAL